MGSCSEGGFTRRKEQVCPRQIRTRGRLLRNVQRRPDPSSEESERQPDAGTLPRRRSASCLRGSAARSPSTICVGGKGSSPTPTMHGRRSSTGVARARRSLSAIAHRSYAGGREVEQALEEGWKRGVAYAMTDGIISRQEEERLRAFRDQLALAARPRNTVGECLGV